MKKMSLRNFIITYGRYIIISVLFILIGNVLLYLIYANVKQEMIESQNAGQMIHAKQAAKGIENFFDNHIAMLQTMAKNEHVVALDAYGKRVMRDYYSSYPAEISIITRIDSQGRILHPEPYDPKVIRQIVTKIEDFREVKRTHQIVVSDVFTNRRGFKTIIAHVPVFKRGSFDGSLALLFPFDFIARRYVEDIRIGQDGYAWIISKSGIELSCPVPGHVGNSVFDNCRDFPDIIAMAKKMTRGEQGVTTYQFDRIRGEAVSKTTNHAVFMPIRVGNNFWSIVVATPEDEILSSLQSFRNRIILIAILILIGMGFFFYVLFRNHILAEEIERRRKVEDALLESEERFRLSMEATSDGLWDWNIKTDKGYFSPSYYLMLGYEVGAFPMEGNAWMNLIHPDDRENTQRANMDCAEGRCETFEVEFRMKAKNGEWRWILGRGKGVECDERGRALRLVGTHVDITDRKRAEEALKESENKYRLLADNVNDVIFVLDMNLNYTYISPSVKILRGYEPAEVLKQPSFETLTPSSWDLATRTLSEVIELEKSEHREIPIFRTLQLEMRRKDGTTVWTEVKFSFIRDENQRPVGILGVTRDITDRKEAAEELLRTLESLRKAVGTTIQAMVSAVETRDPYTSGHQIRSADLARAIATEMGLSQDKIDGIRMAGSIHDIGKLSIPAEILSKPTKLSEIEFSLIKEHARQGFEILKGVESPWLLAEMVYQHHERMDGSGYPRNLKGEDILIEARILAIADVVESMASHRPYRPALGIDAALEEISKNRGILYDPEVTDACLKLFHEKGYCFN